MPNFLVADYKTGAGGTACAAFLYTNGTPVQIGDIFGSVGVFPKANACPRSGAIQFGGDLYALARNGIYKKDDPTSMTGPWSNVLSWLTAPSNGETTIGLFVIGTELIALSGGNGPSVNAWRWAKFDGTTWTQAPSQVSSVTMNLFTDMIVYHNVVYILGTQNNGTIATLTFDPSTNMFAAPSAAWPAGSFQPHGMCVFEDRLFCISQNGITLHALYEYTGSWILVESFAPVVQPGGTYLIGKWALFTDGVTMTALAAGNNAGNGWLSFEWDTSLTRSDISVAVVPSALLNNHATYGGSHPAVSPIDERMTPVYDLNSVVGTTDIYLYYTVNGTSGTTFTVYKWNGNASVMTIVDSGGGNVYHSLPTGFPNFGERIFTAGELDIKITNRVGVVGGEQISFIAYGGGTGRKMKLHYILEGTPPTLPATLALPVTGGSATLNTGSNQVEGIAADGATVYTIVWDVQTDGLGVSNRVSRVPEVLA